MRPDGVQDIYPLAPMQEGLLFQSLSQPESRAYFVQMTFDVEGPLDLDAFRRSWQLLFARHDILRTAFMHEEVSQPLQVVLEKREPPIAIHDVSGLSPEERHAFIESCTARDREHGFDFQHEPLMRLTLFRLSGTLHHLIWSYHHLLLDGWCLGVLHGELLEIYDAIREGRAPALPPPRPYRGYIDWLQAQDRATALGHWSRVLAGCEQATRVTPMVLLSNAPFEAREHLLQLDPATTRDLTALAAAIPVTLSTAMQAVWSIVLSAYNDSSDVVFGAVVSGRPPEVEGIEEMIGLFINTVPVRARLRPEISFIDLARELQSAALDGAPYQSLPLADVQALTPVGRALFDHVVVFENYPADNGRRVRDDDILFRFTGAHDRTHYDFSLVVIPGPQLVIKLMYNASVYGTRQIERIARHIETTARRVAASPMAPLPCISILPDDEREQLLTFRGPNAPPSPHRSIVDWLDAQAERTPDAVAVVFGETKLSYRQLHRRANAFARTLPAAERIAILMPRSIDLVISVLGMLKAGSAYVPIDTALPPAQIDAIVRDSGCYTVITRIAEGKDDAPAVSIAPGDLAYVLYTSGSTGAPKGCAIEHRNLLHYLRWANAYYFENDDEGSFPLFTSIAFDLTVTSLFLPLLRGKTLYVFPQDAGIDDVLADGRFDSLKLTPSHCSLIERQAPNIRVAIVGGEALTHRHVESLTSMNPDVRIHNEFGPTETTVGCVVKRIDPSDERILIGRPIDDTAVYVLDRNGNLAPLGVAGEMFLAGADVGRGYFGNDSLTRARFLPSPFVDGERMYRSGDIGRWLTNGDLDFLGRNDDQVKVRGHRLDLGEIEIALQRCDGVRRAVVLARGTDLIAWIESDSPVDVEALRSLVPDWMIPTRFAYIDRLPLTRNGKIDKAALPDPEPLAATASVAPRDPVEEQILLIWSEVLGERGAGIDDNFFDLGGHSLKAMQVVSRIHRGLGVKLSVHDFLEAPTVSGIAALVRAAKPSPYASIERAEEREHYELSHAQQRLWLLHRMKGEVAYNMPKASLFEGDLDVDALRRAFAAMVDRHEALRTAFVVVNGEPRQEIREHVEVVIPEIDVSAESDPDAAARRIADADAIRPFDLATPPLVRFTIIRLGTRRHVLLLTMHHIIGDGWSLNVIHRELAALYESADSLPPLRIHYKDFAAWQNAAGFAGDERYWLDKLHGMPHSLRLPYDLAPAEDERDFRGSTERLALSEATTAALKKLAAQKGTTVSNIVLACFGAVLFSISRQEDFCIGVSIANRNDPDVEALIGFFVNILPLRVRASQTMTFDDLLDAVVRDAYEAFAHQDYPFDLLVRRMNPDRVTNRQPLLNIVYGFQNFADVRVDVGGDVDSSMADSAGRSRDFPIAFLTSKFDLCLFVSDLRATLLLELEFDTGLFLTPTIRRVLRAMERCIDRACEGAARELGSLELIEGGEEEELLTVMRAINETATDYPRHATVHGLFSEIAASSPDAIAAVFEGTTLTYAELECRSNRLARFLIDAGVKREDFVAVMLDRSLEVVVALLAILKAGAAYVPLSGDMPHERLRYVLADTGARMLITETRSIGMANRLQWDCPALDAFLCVDSDRVHGEIENSGGIMAAEVWDYIADEAFDDISGGGWKSSYTGEWLSREVMDEYGDNIAAKLTPLLGPRSRVLEIGCASGISMFRLAPSVARYYGTDLSPGIIRRSEHEARRRNLQDVIRLAPLAAHEIDRLDERGFDVVILNSVIECFSGHNYLRDVLRKAIDLLNDDGFLFLGNVWDQDLKPQFVQSLLDFKRSHPEAGKHAKTDRTDELFLSRAFLEDLRFDFPEIASIDTSTMLGSAESELSQFGFDAIVSVRKAGTPPSRRLARRRPAADSDGRRDGARPAGEDAGVPIVRRNKRQFDRSNVAPISDEPLPETTTADGLAYLIYTSGTSGQPKGVMVEHRSIVRLVLDTDYIRFGPDDRVLQAGALSFDASTFEIWGPLLNGGRVILPRGTSFLQPGDLRALIRDEGITAMFLTASLFNQIVDEDVHVFDGLRTLLAGGEKVSARAFNLVHAALPSLALKNGYGPTENTTFSTSFQMHGPIDGEVPIGRPIANSTAWVLDDNRRLVPTGMPGELFVGGDGLARGYWNDPELTCRKFVDHPFAPGQRLYRTGDLVRQLADGNIEYIGRIDTQTKIRGYRIELEEIESHLFRHDGVTGTAVAAVERRIGDKELVAFVSGTGVDLNALREHLRARLPQYMVPSLFVPVDRFQLNANGKIDRGALPIPDFEQPVTDAVLPSTDTEKRLAAIWKRVLQRSNVSVTDDFFDLGGHSLKVVRLVSLIQKELDVDVPLTIVFRAPTIHELANYIDDARRFDLRLVDDILVPLNRERQGTTLFAFPPGSGYCLAYQQLAERLPFPLFGFGFIEHDARMEEYVRRIRATCVGPYILFGYSAGGKLAFRVAQELEGVGEMVSDIVLLDAARYHRPVVFRDEEIREVAAGFLDTVSSQVLRDKALTRMRRYRKFIGQSVESGTVAANIHLIVASDSKDFYDERTLVASFDGWSELTTARFIAHAGSGTHLEMLQPPYLDANAETLRAIVMSVTSQAVTSRREADCG
jgi:amino acid adenylation domain-containing protein